MNELLLSDANWSNELFFNIFFLSRKPYIEFIQHEILAER